MSRLRLLVVDLLGPIGIAGVGTFGVDDVLKLSSAVFCFGSGVTVLLLCC